MSRLEDCKYILDEISKVGISIDSNTASNFYDYYLSLIEANNIMNLTTITDFHDVLIKHFIDSIYIGNYYKFEDGIKMIDIGTGAGFPGLPIKLVHRGINATLVDSLNKRVGYLNDIISHLNLVDIVAIHSRAEDIGKDLMHREKYDVAVSRAVSNMSVLAEYNLPLLKVGGLLVAYKSNEYKDELHNASTAIRILGGELDKVHTFELPNGGGKRSLILVNKVRNTESKYPRQSGKPEKKPL